MKKILRKLLALNLTVIMLLAMMVPAMAWVYDGEYGFDVLGEDDGPGYYKVTNSLPEDVKVYEAFCMGYWVPCVFGGANFLHGGSVQGDELPPMPNAYTPATVATGGENVYYLDTNADNRAGSYPDDKLPFGYEWCYEQKYAAEDKVTYERIEPTLNNINFAAAPKGAYVYRSDVEFTYSDNSTDSSDTNESYVIYRGRTPIKKTFFEGKGWLYVLEANTDYYVVKNNGSFAGAKEPFVNTFVDVFETSWFYDAVKFAVSGGLMNGTSVTKFEPNTPMSRAMLVTVLWRLEGSPTPAGRNPFTDLKQDWYKDAVNWAYQNSIVNGTDPDKFSPNGNITREQMAAILYRYSEYKGKDVSARADISAYPDADTTHSYAKDAISWANAEGLITGSKEGNQTVLAPRASATRAQVATILMRYCNK